jgi:O-antigen/teichoic acid export membrane protein
VAPDLIARDAPAAGPPDAVEPPSTGRHAIWMVASTLVVALMNYALNIFLGWALPLDAYGRVGVVQTLIFICTWFLSAGFPWVVSRTLAQAHGAGPRDGGIGAAAWRTFKTAWVTNAALAAVVVAGLGAAAAGGALALGAAYGPLLVMAGVTVGALGVSAAPDAALQGLFRFGRIATFRVVEAAANLLISVALVILGAGALGALAGFAAAAVLACGLNIGAIRDTRFWQAPGWGGLRDLRPAALMTLAVFGGVLLTNIDLLAIKFLGGSAGDSLSGTYQVAAVLARAPLFVGSALVSTFYPRIAREGDAAAGDLLRWLALVVLPMNMILIAAAPAVVAFFFPARFAPASGLLALLAAGSACLVLAGGLAGIQQARGQTRRPAAVMTLAVAAQVLGLAWLVPMWGATGAALTSAGAGALACGLLLAGRVRVPVAARTWRRQGLALGVVGLVSLPLTFFLADANRFIVALWVVAAAALYAVAVLLLNLLDVERQFPAAGLSAKGLLPGAARRLLTVGAALNRAGRSHTSAL